MESGPWAALIYIGAGIAAGALIIWVIFGVV